GAPVARGADQPRRRLRHALPVHARERVPAVARSRGAGDQANRAVLNPRSVMFEFRLPDIGEGVVEGEVVKWHVKPGDNVREDQPMVEVMTDKATVEIPSPKAGVIKEIRAAEGSTCAVGAVMVVIDDAGGASKASSSGTAPSPQAKEERQFLDKTPKSEPASVSAQ